MTTPSEPDKLEDLLEQVLDQQTNTVTIGEEVYFKDDNDYPSQIKQSIKQLISNAEVSGRIDELKNVLRNHAVSTQCYEELDDRLSELNNKRGSDGR